MTRITFLMKIIHKKNSVYNNKYNTGYFKGRCHHCTEEISVKYLVIQRTLLKKRACCYNGIRDTKKRSDGAMKPINRGFFFNESTQHDDTKKEVVSM